MRVILTLCLATVAAASLFTAASADTMSSSMMSAATATVVMPASLKWMPDKTLKGVWEAPVYGDPMKAGMYTMRIKMADGAKVPVHWHNDSERVTVLSGTLMFGVGHSFDMASMKTLGPGSFLFIPAGVHHYAMAKGETVVQTSGNGPFTMNYMK